LNPAFAEKAGDYALKIIFDKWYCLFIPLINKKD